jgi:hypothetical protein
MKLTSKIEISVADVANRKTELPATLTRRVPTVYQAAFLAAKEICDKNTVKPQAIICISALGCLNETISFLDKLEETTFGSPKDFVFSVHNSLGAMLAKEFLITGANITLTDTSIEKAVEIDENLDEKTILIVEFDDKNEFAEKVLQKCNKPISNTPLITAILYSKEAC